MTYEGPSAEEVDRAARLLEGVAIRTPMEESRWLSHVAGGPVMLKAENLQRAGSFKILGAYTRMSGLSDEERANGVVAASAGNHAQGVALAAQLLGIKAVVFMPEGASIPKEKATRGYGAEVRSVGATIDEALVEARGYAAETGAVLVHPFDHPDIVAGQATCGLEILEQCPEVRTVLVPTGGGGLLAGISTVLKRARPEIRVVGVQAQGAAAYPTSLAEGHPVALDSMATMADGIAVGRPGDVPFAAIARHVDDFLTVDEEALSQALLMLVERAKLVVEPAGAAAVAALTAHPDRFETPAVGVLSGGNIDPILLMDVLRHGMATTGRYLDFKALIPDRPGGLAQLLRELADVDANVLDVVHQRTSAKLHIGEVEVELQVETRGPGHAERVLTHLRGCGYSVTV
jgi:threonine dehydratase